MLKIIKSVIKLYQKIRRPATVTIGGLKVFSGEGVPSEIRKQLYRLRHEDEELNILGELLNPSDKVIECGAGIGATTAKIGKLVGADNLISLEPNLAAHEFIHKTLALNNVDLRVLPMAISTDDQGLDLYLMENWLSSSSTQRSFEAKKTRVQTTTLNILKQQMPANVLVMDVEGAENDVLTEDSLQGFDKLLIEFHPHIVGVKSANELKSNLLSWGFENITPLDPKVVAFIRKK